VARRPRAPARPAGARARPPLAAAARGRGAPRRPAQQRGHGRQPPRPLRGARDARRAGRGAADRAPHRPPLRRRQRPARGQPPRPPRRRCQGNRPLRFIKWENKWHVFLTTRHFFFCLSRNRPINVTDVKLTILRYRKV